MTHSSIGASSAKRWIACPGSIKLCGTVPPLPSSKYAEGGKRAHAVAEAYILGQPIPFYADEAMIEGAKMYSRAISERMLNCDEITHSLCLESRVSIPSLDPRAFGTCDAWFVGDRTLYILDYKYGQGVSVSPVENDQLKYYAAGVIETFKLINYVYRIVLAIVQPRCGGVSEWVCDLNQIRSFIMQAKGAVLQSRSANPPMQAGDHCRWCAAQAICPVKRKEVEDLFNVDLQAPSIVKESPQDLSPEDIVRYIDHAETIQSWLKALKYHAQGLIEMGCDVPGYAVEQGMSNRNWKNPEQVTQDPRFLGLPIHNFTLKSPAQMEKIKGIDKKLIADLTERKPTEKKLVKKDGGVNTGLFKAFTED
jgi:hypothetical protein